MFRRLNSTPVRKQCDLTADQITVDVINVQKSTADTFFKPHADKPEEWMSELRDFERVSSELVAALDDAGDKRDQLLQLQIRTDEAARVLRAQANQLSH